jgi:hypothetical protein
MVLFDRMDSSVSQSALVTEPDMITEDPSMVISMEYDGDAADMNIEENRIASAAEKALALLIAHSPC